jgi:hypothetical protein
MAAQTQSSDLQRQVETSNFSAQAGVSIKLQRLGDALSLKAEWDCAKPHSEETPWLWDAAARNYKPGQEREDVLCLVFSSEKEPDGVLDIWLWRAGRSAPSRLADDLHLNASSQVPSFDAGRLPWTCYAPGSFAGEKLPRFRQGCASGSAADVAAEGVWENGRWRVAFLRKLDTGEKDDLPFKPGGGVWLRVLREAPATRAGLLAVPASELKIPLESSNAPEDGK